MKADIEQRTVFRPGLGQYIYMLFLPAFFAIAYLWLLIHPAGYSKPGEAAFVVLFGVVLVIVFAYVLGMRIELDDQRVSKVYLFGVLRRTIPRQQLSASEAEEGSRGRTYTRVDFKTADGKGGSFSVYPFWVWRSTDIDLLEAIAAARKHPNRYDLELGKLDGEFAIDTTVTYAVRLDSAQGPTLGHCTVVWPHNRGHTVIHAIAAGQSVEPDFQISFPREDVRFYAAWEVDHGGTSHLSEVIMVRRGIGFTH